MQILVDRYFVKIVYQDYHNNLLVVHCVLLVDKVNTQKSTKQLHVKNAPRDGHKITRRILNVISVILVNMQKVKVALIAKIVRPVKSRYLRVALLVLFVVKVNSPIILESVHLVRSGNLMIKKVEYLVKSVQKVILQRTLKVLYVMNAQQDTLQRTLVKLLVQFV